MWRPTGTCTSWRRACTSPTVRLPPWSWMTSVPSPMQGELKHCSGIQFDVQCLETECQVPACFESCLLVSVLVPDPARVVCRGEGKSRDESLIRTLAYLCDSVDYVRQASVILCLTACRVSIAKADLEVSSHAAEHGTDVKCGDAPLLAEVLIRILLLLSHFVSTLCGTASRCNPMRGPSYHQKLIMACLVLAQQQGERSAAMPAGGVRCKRPGGAQTALHPAALAAAGAYDPQ